MTRELLELREHDAAITARLKGPMSNAERALEVADRRDIRARIAILESQREDAARDTLQGPEVTPMAEWEEKQSEITPEPETPFDLKENL